ncbi:putative ABC transport system permease protein [Sphingobacterium nematocida]|uniref:Putative ABC transport system permease protein n=1 Tax=Sphingobacterium nematocida TaxID=1513896 RepID=A0A1T5FW06_9SPHI|nr:FtsX-like permease family protein [Sphingobacterium nematocida]SKC00322.1 putative ABC transport system permease protein [Sphingobacterium nematocida]
MNTFALVWKNITQQWGATLLSIVLTAFGVAILLVIYISGDTFEKQLENNSKNVDLVIGAKGSPMQLILSSLYHVDNPTGNISLAEANKIAENPFVQLAVPISLGDNYKGHRIIGTDTSFMGLYELKMAEGKLWSKSFEIVLGAEVARKHQLKIGDEIHSAHGLSADAHVHDDHPFKVVGILSPARSVVDNLILSNLASVWEVHGIAHEGEHIHGPDCDHDHDHNHDHGDGDHNHQHATAHEHTHDHVEAEEGLVKEKPIMESPTMVKSIGQDMIEDHGVEITALLVKYSSPAAIGVLPRLVNQSTHMQAASPAIESSRIFSLLGVGLDSLAILAYVIMLIAALSVFISLYNALKDRRYDMAIMRTMGATKAKLFTLVVAEGLVITLIGGVIGLLLGHSILYYISTQTSQSADFIEAFKLYPNELLILAAAIALGVIAALIPAFKAYNTTISKTLASK